MKPDYSNWLNVTDFVPREDQTCIIDEILRIYHEKKCGVFFIHGPQGCGKSMIQLLLAKKITKKDQEPNLCNTFNPTHPGESFISLYEEVAPSKEAPLIVVLEEADIILNHVHAGDIPRHKSLPVLISNKTSWNQFFDLFDRGYYPWVILILTSNVKPEVIDNLDPSYIREGRINKIFEM